MGGQSQTPARSRTPALIIKGIIALAVTAATLWWASRGVPLDEVGDRLFQTSIAPVLLYLGSGLVIHFIRTVRWGLLVLPLGNPSKRAILSAASIGIPASMFLPLRLGEFVRPAILARSGVPFASGLASVVVERVADGLTNVGLFFTLFAMLPESAPIPDEVRLGSKVALVVFGGACVVLAVIAYLKEPAIRMVRRILEPISASLADKVATLLSTFLVGLRPLMKPSRLAAFVGLTALYWGISGAVTWYLITGYGVAVPKLAGPFTISVLVFAVMIPAGPAFAGTMEAGFKAGLTPFGVSFVDAFVVGICAHVLTIISMVVILFVGFLAAEPKSNGEVETGVR